jgi:Cu/Ag efflux protein CusF
MHTPYLAALTLVAFALVASLSGWETVPPQAPTSASGAETSKPIRISATIEAIDKSARAITLKGPKGNLATVYADESMKRFDELKVGDTVNATYYESIAVHVRKPGEPAPKPADLAVTRNPSMPGATAASQETATVVVQSVDRANRSVTVKRADGGIISMRVENPKYLDMAKPGDTVDIFFTRALLVSVEPGK